MAEERGLVVDVEGFNNAMDDARERARTARGKVCIYVKELFLAVNHARFIVRFFIPCDGNKHIFLA